MANEQKPNLPNEQETDVSKAQAAQQPQGQAGQQPENREKQQTEFGQDQSESQPDEGMQRETATRQDTDIEGASKLKEKGEPESGFVGSQSDADSSSELVEDEDFAKGGQGAPEGK